MAHNLKRTLFIGLGGTGINAILAVKQRLLEVYDPQKMKDVPPMIEFLGIDTDDKDKKKTEDGLHVKLEPAEFKKLTVENIRDTFRANKHIRNRIPKEIQNTRKAAINSGAGQIRALGTLSLMANYKKVRDALVSKVNKIKNWDAEGDRNSVWETGGSDINIFVVFSTSGGTGSGIFLDIAYIIREKCNLSDQDNLISYILLPGPFIGKPGTNNVIPNAYAAFKELDHLKNYSIGSTDHNITFDYGESLGHDKFKITSDPYNYIYLVSNENVDGIMYNSLDTIIEFIGYALFVTTGAVGDAADSIWDNLEGMLQNEFTMDDHSDVKIGNYLCFGISELFYNGKKAAGHAKNEAVVNLIKSVLTETIEDVNTIVNNYIQSNNLSEAGLSNNEVINCILQIQQRPIEEVEPGSNALEYIKTIKSNYLTKITTECGDLAASNCDSFITETQDSLDKQIDDFLKSKGGLDLAIKFLSGIEFYMTSVKNEMGNEITEYEEKAKQIKNYYRSTGDDIKVGLEVFWPRARKHKVKEACDAYSNYVKQEGALIQEIIKRKEAKRFFATILSGVLANKNNLLSIRSNIDSINTDINQIVSNTRNAKIVSKAYSIDLSHDIISEMDIPEIKFDDFIGYLNANNITPRVWYNFTADKLKKTLFDYVSNLEIINHYNELTVEDVMMGFEDNKRKDIVKKLDKMSAPLCPYKKAYVSSINTLHIIGVENETTTILKDNNLDLLSQISYTYAPTFSSTNDPNRWLIFKTEAALPGYALKDFDKYKTMYDYRIKQSNRSRSQTISFHVYEGWESFPELIPEVHNENALRLWALGFSEPIKVIKRIRGRYWIYTQVGDEIINPKYDGWEKISESQDRIRNFEIFQTNEDYMSVINYLVEKKINEIGEKAIIEELRIYVETLIDEQKKVTTHEMSRQLAKEIREIKANIKVFSTAF